MTKKYIKTSTKSTVKSVYHTDPNCIRLADNCRPVSEHEIEYHNLTHCQVCDPNVDSPNVNRNQDFSYQNALKEAAQE